MIKMRATSKKNERGEKYKEEESMEDQEEVIETENFQETTHLSNDYDSTVEL